MIYEPRDIDFNSNDATYYEFLLLTCGSYLFNFKLTDTYYSDDILDHIEHSELSHCLINLFCDKERLINSQIEALSWYEEFWPQFILPEVYAIIKLGQL